MPAAPFADTSNEQALAARRFEDPGVRALAVAAATGDAKTVRRLMQDEGIDPDVVFWGSSGGIPLLVWPIYRSNPDGLKAMLESGADPNVARPYPREEGRSDTNHSNAMVWAAEQEDSVYLEMLLDHGGDPDTRNANNEALLFHAYIKQNKWRNVQILVERGADVNVLAGMGGTIVSMYAGRGGFMMVHWLLRQGADPTLDYAYGKPVHAPDATTIEAIFWHPGDPDDPSWQVACQQWLLARGHSRPPMPRHYREMRQTFGFPHEEGRIPLPDMDETGEGT
ncbi:ankyrin repeat domain-containing protein [Luteimonas deserti]|uniref:Ankyrin repeat domain-containing protein n=1 Tax=Luteimonas deserti TaxID=2752306 RepID=A0A7Z0QU85_9GAMM|nr:ankyrin repeat domain-containing protein [Luteimonas deserti]NYZ63528.1 ankyrin repeat domain-containing protein [Luteimonas deserti]